MPIDPVSIGVGLGTSLAEGGMGLMFGKAQQNMQLKGQKESLKQQGEANYDYWLKTNYAAQKEQMQKAGLNPGLMYGMGGGAGGQSASLSAMPSPTGDGKGMGIAQNAQLSLMKAQERDLNASAALKESGVPVNDVEVPKKAQETKTSAAQEANLKANTSLTEAQKELTNVNTRLQKLHEYILDETKDFDIGKVEQEWNKSVEDYKIAAAKAKVDGATVVEKIKQEGIRTSTMLLEQKVMKKGMDLTDAQIDKLDADISKLFNDQSVDWWNAESAAKNANSNAGRLLQEIADESSLSIGEVVDILGKMAAGAAIGGGMMQGKGKVRMTPEQRRSRMEKKYGKGYGQRFQDPVIK